MYSKIALRNEQPQVILAAFNKNAKVENIFLYGGSATLSFWRNGGAEELTLQRTRNWAPRYKDFVCVLHFWFLPNFKKKTTNTIAESYHYNVKITTTAISITESKMSEELWPTFVKRNNGFREGVVTLAGSNRDVLPTLERRVD